jgi:hypothetical protein
MKFVCYENITGANTLMKKKAGIVFLRIIILQYIFTMDHLYAIFIPLEENTHPSLFPNLS